MGRGATGVIGMKLRKDDKVVGMDIIGSEEKANELNLLVVLARGYGKRTKLKHYKRQKRGGVGIKTANVTEKTGALVSSQILDEEAEDLIAISKKGQVIRTRLAEISILGRATQGVRIMKLRAGDEIASITTL